MAHDPDQDQHQGSPVLDDDEEEEQEEQEEQEDMVDQSQQHANEHGQLEQVSSRPLSPVLALEEPLSHLAVESTAMDDDTVDMADYASVAAAATAAAAATSDNNNRLAPPSQSQSGAGSPLPSSPHPQSSSLAPTEVIKEPTLEVTPRLVIEKMVLVDFKSYAGRQKIGPFHKSFTSIVGPNGSGKSNVIDALLFVFGYRSSKMRQSKLSELIHKSSGAEDIESCTVEIHFCEILDMPGPDNYERVPGSGLVVSRQAYRNNSSKYFVNNFLSSYTAVTTLLKGRGIDLDHNRFLILQGEVESIAQMKAKAQNEHEDGLLEYLEDIIGTAAHKDTIEKLGVELEALNDERSERLTRFKYVEKEKENLEGKKQEAEAYLKNENNLAVKQSALYQIYLWECKKKSAKEEKRIAQLSAKLEEDQSKHKGLRDEIQVLETDHNAIAKEYEKIDAETSEILKQLAKIDREDVQMQENRKHLKSKEKKITKALAADKHSLSDKQSWVRNHEADLVTHQSELEKLEKHLENAEQELENIRQSLKGKTEEFSQQIEVHQKELAPWTAQIVAKQSEADLVQSEHDLLQEKAKNQRAAYEDALEALRTLKSTQESKETEIEELKESIKASAGQIASVERKIAEMAQREKLLKDRANTARNRAEEARSSQQKTQSRSAVLNSLMRQRDLGKINGIQGRLGNLGAIDDKYDVAISTACPSLDNIVVDNVEVGQQCIEFVRKNNLGRVSLILLNKLANRDLRPIQTPENVPRLFDLVRPADPKFAQAFYSVMQDTLVAEDMRQANRIAYGQKRWRVVTLDGKLIDKSGTMTGGGNRVMRGAMSSTLSTGEFSPEAVEKLEHERDQAESVHRFLLQEKLSLERELSSTVASVPEMEMRLTMFKMDVDANEKRIVQSEKRVNMLKKEAEPNSADISKMKQLAKKATELRAEVTSIKKSAQTIEDKIKDLQNKILDAGVLKLRAQKSKVDGLKEQIEALGDKSTKTMVAKSKAEKDAVKLSAQIAKHDKELTEVSEDLQTLEQEIKEKTKEAVGIRKASEEAKQIMEEKKEEMEEMKQKLDAKIQVINKIRTAEVEMKNQLDDLKQSQADLERRIKHWSEQLKELSLQEVDYEEDEIVAELQEISETDLAMIDKHELEQQIQHLEQQISSAEPNLSVLEEYKKREEEYLARAKDLEEMTIRKDEAKKAYDELRKRRLDEFMAGFHIISLKLKEMYQMITMGGNAELELVDSLDPFSEGIIFSVMPPKKSWKNISNLSGGEKTLSSLALVFALHHFKPTPLYVMDEIDAALDFRNVSIVANYIKEWTKNAQFVIISLRNNMFELAEHLVGIYKTDNKTKSVTINPKSITTLRPQPRQATPGLSQSHGGSNHTMHGRRGPGHGPGEGGVRRVSTFSRHTSDLAPNAAGVSSSVNGHSTPRLAVPASQ
ncbi:hypothetical protein EDD11_009728 [Mortierella claussenii]|nr:hypothetical protein EDD11_009728 [Mortierella claussenii]